MTTSQTDARDIDDIENETLQTGNNKGKELLVVDEDIDNFQ